LVLPPAVTLGKSNGQKIGGEWISDDEVAAALGQKGKKVYPRMRALKMFLLWAPLADGKTLGGATAEVVQVVLEYENQRAPLPFVGDAEVRRRSGAGQKQLGKIRRELERAGLLVMRPTERSMAWDFTALGRLYREWVGKVAHARAIGDKKTKIDLADPLGELSPEARARAARNAGRGRKKKPLLKVVRQGMRG
jgi:hypothetical protein